MDTAAQIKVATFATQSVVRSGTFASGERISLVNATAAEFRTDSWLDMTSAIIVASKRPNNPCGNKVRPMSTSTLSPGVDAGRYECATTPRNEIIANQITQKNPARIKPVRDAEASFAASALFA